MFNNRVNDRFLFLLSLQRAESAFEARYGKLYTTLKRMELNTPLLLTALMRENAGALTLRLLLDEQLEVVDRVRQFLLGSSVRAEEIFVLSSDAQNVWLTAWALVVDEEAIVSRPVFSEQLFNSTIAGHADVVMLLLCYSEQTKRQAPRIFELAATFDHVVLLRRLLDNNLVSLYRNGASALWRAVRQRNNRAVDFLLVRGMQDVFEQLDMDPQFKSNLDASSMTYLRQRVYNIRNQLPASRQVLAAASKPLSLLSSSSTL